ncbi:MAG: two-component system, OmpR family, phosphate regulon sensor histidine kinase PhoR [Bacteroidales bacterium]|nr:two-component system, OmpR family, phosphate regulon sensor histidine kinase PhoR [Bacteroidales bacterium]
MMWVAFWAVSFLFILWLTNNFIYDKIRVIYKIIHNQKVPKDVNPKETIKAESLEEIDAEVEAWSEERREEVDKLREMERYRREYIGNISHELKTPIFNIQGYILTLLDGGLEDPEVNRTYLLKAEKNVNRLIAMIEDLETINLLESNELKLNFTRFNLVDLVREAMESLELKAAKKECKWVLNHEIEIPLFVKADRHRIMQVLVNLLDNAIKYGKKEGGRVKVSFFDMDEHILAEVTDDGPGIPQEYLPRIFERFFRIDKGRSRSQGGTGLGLAIVKHIMEAHGQTVTVRSTPGIGTTFGITLKKA